MDNSILVQKFIDQIWNNKSLEDLEIFLHPLFKDHSLPQMLSPDKEGTKKWIITTGLSFEHQTIIEDQVSEGDQCIVKIRMNLKHTGIWRGIEPTGVELHTTGYRQFKMKEGRIIEHWALIDGQNIENQLKATTKECKIVE